MKYFFYNMLKFTSASELYLGSETFSWIYNFKLIKAHKLDTYPPGLKPGLISSPSWWG